MVLGKRSIKIADFGDQDKSLRSGGDLVQNKRIKVSLSSISLASNAVRLPDNEMGSNTYTTTNPIEYIPYNYRKSSQNNNEEACVFNEAKNNGSSYGWFVELNNNFNAGTGNLRDLEYSALTSQKTAFLEEEEKRVLAANIVDNVLANIF